jgi:hypothetical protein
MDVQFDPIKLTADNQERMTFFSVTNSYWRAQRDIFKKDFEDVMLKAVRDGSLDPFLGGKFRLEDKVKVDEMLASGEGVKGKLIYIVDEQLWERQGLGSLSTQVY